MRAQARSLGHLTLSVSSDDGGATDAGAGVPTPRAWSRRHSVIRSVVPHEAAPAAASARALKRVPTIPTVRAAGSLKDISSVIFREDHADGGAAGGRRHVLVADSDRNSRVLVRNMLGKFAFDVRHRATAPHLPTPLLRHITSSPLRCPSPLRLSLCAVFMRVFSRVYSCVCVCVFSCR